MAESTITVAVRDERLAAVRKYAEGLYNLSLQIDVLGLYEHAGNVGPAAERQLRELGERIGAMADVYFDISRAS